MLNKKELLHTNFIRLENERKKLACQQISFRSSIHIVKQSMILATPQNSAARSEILELYKDGLPFTQIPYKYDLPEYPYGWIPSELR